MVALSQTGELEPVLLAAREGDPEAFRQLSDTYLASLTAFARQRNSEDPEEIANMALYDGFSNLYRFRSHTSSSFRAYLFRCAANRINTEHRKVKPHYVPISDEVLWSHPDETDELVPSDEWFNQTIVALPVDQRAVIKERFGEGSTVAETARRLGKSVDSIKNLQERALHRLRRDLVLAGAMVALVVLVVAAISSRSADVKVESIPADGGSLPSSSSSSSSSSPVGPTADGGLRLGAFEGARSTSDPTAPPSDESPGAETSIFSGSSATAGSGDASVAEAGPEVEPAAPVSTADAEQSDTTLVTEDTSPTTSTPDSNGEPTVPPEGTSTSEADGPGKSSKAPGKSSSDPDDSSDGPGKASDDRGKPSKAPKPPKKGDDS